MNNIASRPTLNSFHPQGHIQNYATIRPANTSPLHRIENTPHETLEEADIPKTVGMAALLQALAMSLNTISDWCGKKLMQGKEFTSKENIKKVADHMVNKNGLDVHVGYLDPTNVASYANKYGNNMLGELQTVARGQNAFYMDSAKLAVAPQKKPSLILHELGHAINAQKGKFMKTLQGLRGIGTAIPTLLLLLNGFIPKKEGEKENFVQKHAGLIGFSAFLPTIVEEGAASIKGIKAARTVLGKAANLGALKRNYAFAWCTYLLAGLGLGVAAKQAIVNDR